MLWIFVISAFYKLITHKIFYLLLQWICFQIWNTLKLRFCRQYILLANCGKQYGYTWLLSKPLGNVPYFCPSANKSPLRAECTVRLLSALASSVRNSVLEQMDELQNVYGW